MLSSGISQTRLFDDSVEYEDENNTSFLKDIILIFIKFVCVIYFILGLVLCVARLEMMVGSSIGNEGVKSANVYFIILQVLNVFTILNILLLIYMKYLNHTSFNFIIHMPVENRQVLYWMALPLIIISILYMILATIYNVIFHTNTTSIMSTIIQIFFFISVFLLMEDTGGIINTGESYHLKIVNTTALFVTLIGIINNTFIHIFDNELDTLLEIIEKDYNISLLYIRHTNSSLGIQIEKIEKTLVTAIICFGLTSFGYLLGPFKRHLIDIEELTVDSESMTSTESSDHNPNSIVFVNQTRTSGLSLLVGIVIITLSLLTYPAYFSLDVTSMDTEASHMIFMVMYTPIYFIAIVLLVIMLRKSKTWGNHNNYSIVDQVLLNVSFCGTILQTFLILSDNFEKIQYTENLTIGFYLYVGMKTFNNFLHLIYLVLQTLFIDIALQKNSVCHQNFHMVKNIDPVIIILSVNISFFLSNLLSGLFLETFTIQEMPIKLFQHLTREIEVPISTIYRLYAIVFFSKLVLKIE